MKLETIMNFNVMKCPHLLFSIKGIKTNIGFCSFIPIFLMYFICIFVFYLNDFNVLKNIINEILFAKQNLKYIDNTSLNEREKSFFLMFISKKKIMFDNMDKNTTRNKEINFKLDLGEKSEKERFKKDNEKSNHEQITQKSLVLSNNNNISNFGKNKNELKKNKRNINFKQPMYSSLFNQSNERDKNEVFHSKINEKNNSNLTNKEKNKVFSKKQKKKIKKILDYIDEELNDMEYKKAQKYDHRTYSQYYFSLLKSNHIIIKIWNNNDYNSRIIKIFLAFINFGSIYTVNALFFNDETMHKICEDGGDFNFIYQLPQIAYSTIISFIIDNIINSLALTQNDILSIKKEKKIDNAIQKAKVVIKALYIQFIFFFIISFIFILLFWYYLGCFCAVYKNTQYHLIKDTLISYGTGNLYPVAISLFPGIFRIYSLADKFKSRRIFYKISKLIAQF